MQANVDQYAVKKLYYSPNWYDDVNYMVAIDSIRQDGGLERTIFCSSSLNGTEQDPFRYVVSPDGEVTLYTADGAVFSKEYHLCSEVSDRIAIKGGYIECLGEITMPYFDTVLTVKIFLWVNVFKQGTDSTEKPNHYIYVSNDFGPIQELSYDLHEVRWPLRGAVVGDRHLGTTTVGVVSTSNLSDAVDSSVSIRKVDDRIKIQCLYEGGDLHDLTIVASDLMGKVFDIRVDERTPGGLTINIDSYSSCVLLFARCNRHSSSGRTQFIR